MGHWLQVDLKIPMYVTGAVTQGRYDFDQWVTSYKIRYGNSIDEMQFIQDSNGDDIVRQANIVLAVLFKTLRWSNDIQRCIMWFSNYVSAGPVNSYLSA